MCPIILVLYIQFPLVSWVLILGAWDGPLVRFPELGMAHGGLSVVDHQHDRSRLSNVQSFLHRLVYFGDSSMDSQ
jgi:hypothetical protein